MKTSVGRLLPFVLSAFLGTPGCGPGTSAPVGAGDVPLSFAGGGPKRPPAEPDRFLQVEHAVPGEYIVVLREGFSTEAAEHLVKVYGGAILFKYQYALNGFALRAQPANAKAMSADPSVDYIIENATLKFAQVSPKFAQVSPTIQKDPPWGLDRVDQRSGSLTKNYGYTTTGNGVHAYIIDSGIRATHTEFGNRVYKGYSALGDDPHNDCNGHGTAIAGVVGANTWGVAKNVLLHPVKVAHCDAPDYKYLIRGIDWVRGNPLMPAVANLSVDSPVYPALDTAVKNAIAAGITFVVAAGNHDQDACTRSAARVAEAITVAAWAFG